MNEQISLDDVVHAMLTFGGSFVHALAECFQRADESNRRRLIEAFPDVLEEYREIVRLRMAR